MPVNDDGGPSERSDRALIRVAAAGDIHCSGPNREQIEHAFGEIDDSADLVLLAGDLTTHGEPDQARVLSDACRSLRVPVVAVLGNHDLHSKRAAEVTRTLEDGDIIVLDRTSTTLEVCGCEVGIAGVKGFVGGFPGSHLPDFGEPSLRAVYAEAGEEVEALDAGLRAISTCPFRIALLHYSPTAETLEGEPREIWAFLGTDRLAAPIAEHGPDLALHGHAHAGRFKGSIANVPVFNVSVPVMGRDFWVFELSSPERPTTPIH